MNFTWPAITWQQFGAAIDMLDNALGACPDELWSASVWEDPTDAPEYTHFWFIVYHTLAWTDRYLSGAPEGFAPPAPFVAGKLPAQPYTRAQLQAYLLHCRSKCQATFEALTDEQAARDCAFPWGEPVSFAELQLYSLRHVQEHASQLSLFLGGRTGSAPDWVARADHRHA